MGGARSNPGAEYRVLVVEDSGTVRRLIARILLRAGFAVTEAVDGLDAVVRCALDRPDVIVLDLEMPRCGGMDALIQEHDSVSHRAGSRLPAGSCAPARRPTS